jgi:hypothetical protein
MQTEHWGTTWFRNYQGTDLVAWVSHGEVKFIDLVRPGEVLHLGREIDWARAAPPVSCGRRNGSYFARLLSPAVP